MYTHDRDTLQHGVVIEFINQINPESVALPKFIALGVFSDGRTWA